MRANLQQSRSSAVVAIAMIAIITLAGCTFSSGSSGSRSKGYHSIDALARDSTAVVVGTVLDRRQEADTAISSVEVSHIPSTPGLGADTGWELSDIAVGDTIQVRQMGGTGSRFVALAQVGLEYLFYLNPSGLPGEAATHYFIVGAEAGFYESDGAVFRRVAKDTGDTLPETIEIGDLVG